MNMFKSSGVDSVDAYVAQLEAERRALVEQVMALVSEATGFEPYFASNMIGYGSFSYRNYKNEQVEWPVIAIASQKNYVSIYVCALSDGQYLAEKYKDSLGNVSVGRSCIRFKKLEDVKIPVLKKVCKEAAENPGLIK